MAANPRIRLLLTCAAMLAVLLIGWALMARRPLPPRMAWLTTPPMRNARGETFRLQVLAPAGWQAGGFFPTANAANMAIGPSLRKNSKDQLGDLFGVKGEEAGIWLGADEQKGADRVERKTERLLVGGKVRNRYTARRRLPTGQGIYYFRENEAAFEATYRQVCESFRVAP